MWIYHESAPLWPAIAGALLYSGGRTMCIRVSARLCVATLTLGLVCLTQQTARAESPTAVGMAIDGRVVNPDGTSCVGCKVTATSESTARTVLTKGDGTFHFIGLPAGEYEVWSANSAGGGAHLLDQFHLVAIKEGIDVRGVELVAPSLSGRTPEPPSLVDCGGKKPCLRGPCDPKRPCCRAFSLDIPRGARLRSGWAASLTIGPDGTVVGGEVRNGCGNKSLDDQLLEKIKENSCFERTETGMIFEFSITFD